MAREEADAPMIGTAQGPYDIESLADEADDLENSHLDLGSVLVPVVEGGQVTVEMTEDHQPQFVHLVTPHGRLTVSAFAAPKTPGLWREVVRELAESVRDEGASTSIEDGHWGREVVAVIDGGTHRFIGVDGPRWMVRAVASGPSELAVELGQLARAVLAETVVRRGSEPFPPREPLPIVLPPVLAEQVAAVQQQMFADPEGLAEAAAAAEPADEDPDDLLDDVVPGGAREQVAQATVWTDNVEPEPEPAPEEDDDPPPPSSGSAMQRFRRRRK